MPKPSFFLANNADVENSTKDSLLANYGLQGDVFPDIDKLRELFLDIDFLKKNEIDRWLTINQLLLGWIIEEKEPAFLLPQVVNFIFEVSKAKVLHGTYSINSFELWLNHYSNSSEEEQYLVRSKIVGKKIPRSSYQLFFPIGKGKIYFGSHIVTAHSSPDIDTTVASFSGWLDAFAARVGTGLHLWNLPGIEPPSLIHKYFSAWFGEYYLSSLSISSETLFLRAMDLIQKPLIENEEKFSNQQDAKDLLSENEEGKPKSRTSKLQDIVLTRSRFDEIEQKMISKKMLTICCIDHNGYSAIGTLSQEFLKKEFLGTVSLRDFSNGEEVKIPSYLQVISVVDHHRTSLNTTIPAQITISDVQSANVLLAEMTFSLNDQYSMLGSKDDLAEQLNHSIKNQQYSIAERVIKKMKVEDGPYYIHPKREFLEYQSFLIAILDDTDLLIKSSERDLHCVAELLNRLKSIQLKQVTEIVSLSDIPKDHNFVNRAARRLLCNVDFYSLYAKDFGFKEQELNALLIQGLRGENLKLFSDTKEQARCARVGQIKFFAKNFPLYLDYSSALRRIWLKEAINQWNKTPRLKFHLQMISTISGADEAFYGRELHYEHSDELWMWIPWDKEEAIETAKEFFEKFSQAPEWKNQTLELEVIGEQCDLWIEMVTSHFSCSFNKQEMALDRQSIGILRFKPGLLNSRKSSISPYLPLKATT